MSKNSTSSTKQQNLQMEQTLKLIWVSNHSTSHNKLRELEWLANPKVKAFQVKYVRITLIQFRFLKKTKKLKRSKASYLIWKLEMARKLPILWLLSIENSHRNQNQMDLKGTLAKLLSLIPILKMWLCRVPNLSSMRKRHQQSYLWWTKEWKALKSKLV